MDIGDLTEERRLAQAQIAALWEEMWQAARILWTQWCDALIDTWMGSHPPSSGLSSIDRTR